MNIEPSATKLRFSPIVEENGAAWFVRAFAPAFIKGIHYAVNGPVERAIAEHGTLTIVDVLWFQYLRFFGLPNGALETKFRAIGNAFEDEAALLARQSSIGG